MTLRYLINDSAVFDPQNCRLWPQSKTEETQTLFVPASQCLSLLIERSGEVVSQRDFFEAVWEKNGLYANANTLYQNIAVLRKALKAAGLNKEVIRTVPRQGFSFTGYTTELTSEEEIAPTEALMPEPRSPEWVEKEKIAPMPPSHTANKPFLNIVLWMVPGLIICLSSGSLLWQRYADRQTQSLIATHYYNIGLIDGCHLYSTWQDQQAGIGYFRKLLVSTHQQCRSGDYAYLTFMGLDYKASLIKCSRPLIDRAAECTTYIDQDFANEME